MLLDLLLFIASCGVLVWSGSWIVKHLSNIASFFNLSGFVAAFILMAFSTSLPELFLGISAALNNEGAIALGTIIGSNVANLSIVIGLAIIISRGIRVPSKTIRRDSVYVFGIVVLLTVLASLGGGLSRIDGAILLVVFVWYVFNLFKSRKRFSKKPLSDKRPKDIAYSFAVFFVGIVILLISAEFVVETGTALALDLSLPPILIGLFLVGLGSSLPELVFQVRTSLAKKGGMSLGDALGSVVANSTLIIGLSALISPIEMHFSFFFLGAMFMVGITFIFVVFMHRGRDLTTREGIVLLFTYVLFVFAEFYLQFIESS